METKTLVPTVMVVDDEEDLRELLMEEVQSLGYGVVGAPEGKEALRIVGESNKANSKTGPIDMILSDISMPEMNGLEFLDEIRKLNFDIPTIFLTGYGDKDKAVKALRLGAMDFIEKPYDREVLLKSIQKAAQFGLELRNLESELNSLCEKSKIPADQLDSYRVIQRALLILKKESRTFLKKAA